MSKLEKHFEHEREQLRMTQAEKSVMRARLMRAMEAPSEIASPQRSVASPYQWMFAPRSLAMFAVACLIAVTSGTAYAAESSLPGTPLYPVKVKVIEPIAVALATTPTAKAQANAAIAATRVKEAQTLAAQGALTPKVAQEISDNYNAHARAALALVDDADAHDDVTSVSVSTTVTEVDEAMPDEDTAASSIAVAPVEIQTFGISVSPTSLTGSAPVATSTTRTYNTKNRTSGTSSNVTVNATITSSTTASTTSKKATNISNVAQELRASLSAQAKILNQLNTEVRNRHTKTPR